MSEDSRGLGTKGAMPNPAPEGETGAMPAAGEHLAPAPQPEASAGAPDGATIFTPPTRTGGVRDVAPPAPISEEAKNQEAPRPYSPTAEPARVKP
jgi:hypothetical protein